MTNNRKIELVKKANEMNYPRGESGVSNLF